MGRSYTPEAWNRDPRASLGCKALANLLATYAEHEHGNQDVWPAPETVATCLGVTDRYVRQFSAEGETLGWWTRKLEHPRVGGTLLTWRLHFPAFTPNGSRTEAERNQGSAPYEGIKGSRDQGSNPSFSAAKPAPVGAPVKEPQQELTLQPTKQHEPTAGQKRFAKAQMVVEAWNRIMVHQPTCRRIEDRMVAVLATAWDRLGGTDEIGLLFAWATTDVRYNGKSWPKTIAQWLSGASLDAVLQARVNAGQAPRKLTAAQLAIEDAARAVRAQDDQLLRQDMAADEEAQQALRARLPEAEAQWGAEVDAEVAPFRGQFSRSALAMRREGLLLQRLSAAEGA